MFFFSNFHRALFFLSLLLSKRCVVTASKIRRAKGIEEVSVVSSADNHKTEKDDPTDRLLNPTLCHDSDPDSVSDGICLALEAGQCALNSCEYTQSDDDCQHLWCLYDEAVAIENGVRMLQSNTCDNYRGRCRGLCTSCSTVQEVELKIRIEQDFASICPDETPLNCIPSDQPSILPSASIHPSSVPSSGPSVAPSPTPSGTPSREPSESPSTSSKPSSIPSSNPSAPPSSSPSSQPSGVPSHAPSGVPSINPSEPPSRSANPSSKPSNVPSARPSSAPSSSTKPSSGPSDSGSNNPPSNSILEPDVNGCYYTPMLSLRPRATNIFDTPIICPNLYMTHADAIEFCFSNYNVRSPGIFRFGDHNWDYLVGAIGSLAAAGIISFTPPATEPHRVIQHTSPAGPISVPLYCIEDVVDAFWVSGGVTIDDYFCPDVPGLNGDSFMLEGTGYTPCKGEVSCGGHALAFFGAAAGSTLEPSCIGCGHGVNTRARVICAGIPWNTPNERHRLSDNDVRYGENSRLADGTVPRYTWFGSLD